MRKLAREVIDRQLAFVQGKQGDVRPFGPIDRPLPEWFIREDRTPNSRGAREIIGATEHLDPQALLAAMSLGAVKALLTFGADPIAALGGDPRPLGRPSRSSSCSSWSILTRTPPPSAHRGAARGVIRREGRQLRPTRAGGCAAAAGHPGGGREPLGLADRQRAGAPAAANWRFQTAADVDGGDRRQGPRVPGRLSYASCPSAGESWGRSRRGSRHAPSGSSRSSPATSPGRWLPAGGLRDHPVRGSRSTPGGSGAAPP